MNTLKGKNFLFIQALLLLMVTQLSTDIYLPSIPRIAFDLSSSIGVIKLSMTAMILSLGLSQLLAGPLSDSYGRKKVALYGLFIFCLGSVILIEPINPLVMVIGRFVQGIGLGFGLSFSSCVSGDLYKGKKLNVALSIISVVYAVMPVVAPVIGGILQTYFTWKLSFWTLLIFGLLSFIMIRFLFQETNPYLNNKFDIQELLSDYKVCISNNLYLRHLLLASLIYSAEVSYIIQMPIISQKQFHVTPMTAGFLVVFTSIAIVIGSALSAILLRVISSEKIIQYGVFLSCVSIALWFLLLIVFGATIYSMIIPMSGVMLSSGLIFPNSIAKCIELFQEKSGMSASLAIGMLTAIGGLITIFVSLLPSESVIALPVLLSIIVMMMVFLIRPSRYSSNSNLSRCD